MPQLLKVLLLVIIHVANEMSEKKKRKRIVIRSADVTIVGDELKHFLMVLKRNDLAEFAAQKIDYLTQRKTLARNSGDEASAANLERKIQKIKAEMKQRAKDKEDGLTWVSVADYDANLDVDEELKSYRTDIKKMDGSYSIYPNCKSNNKCIEIIDTLENFNNLLETKHNPRNYKLICLSDNKLVKSNRKNLKNYMFFKKNSVCTNASKFLSIFVKLDTKRVVVDLTDEHKNLIVDPIQILKIVIGLYCIMKGGGYLKSFMDSSSTF
ncbi:MAG: hypothetical protein MHMPM18_002507 [Marteilia pararefringens]